MLLECDYEVPFRYASSVAHEDCLVLESAVHWSEDPLHKIGRFPDPVRFGTLPVLGSKPLTDNGMHSRPTCFVSVNDGVAALQLACRVRYCLKRTLNKR